MAFSPELFKRKSGHAYKGLGYRSEIGNNIGGHYLLTIQSIAFNSARNFDNRNDDSEGFFTALKIDAD
jgi:hypothetical protein